MNFEQMMEEVKEYPKLYEVYQKKVDEGYSITGINVSVSNPKLLDLTYIEMMMENEQEESITLIYSEGYVKMNIVRPFPDVEKIHPKMVLNQDYIRMKKLKRKLFGGYDRDEVDQLLDWIAKDYDFVETMLLQKNKILKEDVQK